MAATGPMDGRTFLAHLRRSGLISDRDLDRLLPQLANARGGREVAQGLIDLGALTRFQAERLLAGRNSGFILGQYRILDEIGRGGMGRVFKAEHRTMSRLVALKIIAPELLQTERARDVFFREVRALSKLVHPNIVAAYDANATENRFFLVLEFVDGPNLEQLVRADGPLPVNRACDFICQVANGLQCAHKLGMVHRDIKPANLLVQRRGIDGEEISLVKISDFGLARLQRPDAAAAGNRYSTIHFTENTVIGTPDYLAPEQSRSLHQADIRSDLYGLGCTFYFVLTGYAPFAGGTTIDKLIRHNTVPAPPVTQKRPDTPPAIAAMIARLLAKAPEERFQTPAELAEALAPFCVAGPVAEVPPVSPSALAGDTLPINHSKTVEDRPEFDFTSIDEADSREASGSATAETRSVGRRSGQVKLLDKALRMVQQALGL